MKIASWLLIAASLLTCSSGGEAMFQFDGEVAFSYVERQMEFGHRIPNTEGHVSTGDWILEQLRLRADTVVVQAFDYVTADDDTLHLRNFMGKFRPEAAERILYVAHWDTRPIADKESNMARRRLPTPGANDGASGVALLLGVADQLREVPPAYGVDLLFVDGEDYGDFGRDRDVLIGSKYFAENLPEGYSPLFAVVFDMVGDVDLNIPREGNSENGAPEVVDRFWRKAHEIGFGDFFPNNVGDYVTDDHVPLQRAGIRAIDVIDFSYDYHHTTEDTLDKVGARSLAIVGSVAVALVR